jgi:type I restriction enzyme S subunit
MNLSHKKMLVGAAQSKLGDLLEQFDQRLGTEPEPEILTLTENMGFVPQRERFKKRLAIADTSQYKVIGLHDIAFNPYLLWAGAIAQNTAWKKAIISPLYPTLRVRSGYNARFVNHLLCGGFLRSRYGAISYGSVPRKRRATVTDFLNLEIPRQPSLAEQDRIVKLLDEADELRNLRAQADHRTAALVPALFHDMFGDPSSARNPWPTVPLMNLGRVTTGNTPPRNTTEFFGDFVEWVKTDNIDSTRGIVTKAAEGLSEEGASRGRIVPAGAVLVTCIAGSRKLIGNAAVVDRNVAINQQINAVIPHPDTESAFLCQQIGALKGIIQKRATGIMTGIINKSILESILVIRPPFPLQKEFAARAKEIRTIQAEQAASRGRLDDLFQSVLHRAFNGDL